MSLRMRAAVLREPGALALEQVDVEAPREDEVLVRVQTAGVCHSDVSVARGDFPTPLPAVLGHEGAGIVERVGAGVRHVAAGDRVVVLYRAPCGACRYCLTGRPTLCPQGVALRRSGLLVDGSSRYAVDGERMFHFCGASTFAELAVVPAHGVVRVGDELSFEQLAVVGCAVMTGVGAVFNAAALKPGSSAAVIGCGGVGLNAVQGCAIAGALEIVAIDRDPAALRRAAELGATRCLDASAAGVEELAAEVRALTGDGVDYAFETAGAAATLRLALDLLRPGGTAVAVGIPPHGVELAYDAAPFVVQEKALRGCMYGSVNFARDVPMVLELHRVGKLRLSELVGEVVPFERVAEAILGHESGAARTVVRIGAE